MEWAEEDKSRCSTVRRLLKLTKGWDEAKEHATKVGNQTDLAV